MDDKIAVEVAELFAIVDPIEKEVVAFCRRLVADARREAFLEAAGEVPFDQQWLKKRFMAKAKPAPSEGGVEGRKI